MWLCPTACASPRSHIHCQPCQLHIPRSKPRLCSETRKVELQSSWKTPGHSTPAQLGQLRSHQEASDSTAFKRPNCPLALCTASRREGHPCLNPLPQPWPLTDIFLPGPRAVLCLAKEQKEPPSCSPPPQLWTRCSDSCPHLRHLQGSKCPRMQVWEPSVLPHDQHALQLFWLFTRASLK